MGFREAVAGAAEGLQDTALLGIKAAILNQRDQKLAEIQAQQDERRAGVDQANRVALLEKKAEIEGRRPAAIGAAIADARKPVQETYASEEGDYNVSRTPTRDEALRAGIDKAIELGDFDTAKVLREVTAPKLTKIGADETVVNESGQVVFQNDAGTRRRVGEKLLQHRLDLGKLAAEYGLKKELETFKGKHGESSSTALMRNVDYLVKQGIAKDPADAFGKLRTSTEKPESDAIMSVASILARDPRYRGNAGMARARQDATDMVRSIRRGESTGRGESASRSLFGSPEDVRRAYKRGEIDRPAATRELLNFGFE